MRATDPSSPPLKVFVEGHPSVPPLKVYVEIEPRCSFNIDSLPFSFKGGTEGGKIKFLKTK